ncbi:MAG: sigma-70 family RNA polymerase sigma factor [Planctomycetota bacterium]|nr:MAG: sigma-70 family RNA polymerase sigma factor [Planctomycetota bacterium]
MEAAAGGQVETSDHPTPDSEGTRAVIRRPKMTGRVEADESPRPPPVEDVELIEKVRRGDIEAYGELVRRYQDRVFNACWRICGHLEDARDLTQDAFLRAFERLADFRGESRFYTWVFRIAVNLALSHRRQAQRRPWVSLDGANPDGSQARSLARRSADGSTDDPRDRVEEAELQGRVAHALLTLDPDHRAVIVLRDIEGMDYRTIAAVLDIPPGTVKSRLFRARSALADAVGKGEDRVARDRGNEGT